MSKARNRSGQAEGPALPDSLNTDRMISENSMQDGSFQIIDEQEIAPEPESSDLPNGVLDDLDIRSDIPSRTDEQDDDDLTIVMGTEADVTPEDMQLLGDKDQDMDMGEDELIDKEGLDDTDFDGDLLNEAAVDLDSTGDDLDISGREEYISGKANLTDEENDYYSLGSDDNEDLKEGR